ncbi:phasin family protein [Bradyrhizobium cytisi]|uniref:Phasin n=1 Tax=Bradyrhizobium cytisi TaxID=515489 RepID=A0A5S4X6L8_9BRAD|nr:phasin family protein [Bradyrhizobium cytisi]TYL85123.1 phasin [Bradyrhizobium cytisi]
MTDQSHEPFDLPPEMRNVAESSLKQARDAFEKLLANAEAAAGSIEERGASMRAGAKDIGARAIAFAETNVQASLNYAQSLVHAKDVAEVMRLHSEYVQAQMKALAEQASEIGQIVSRAAMDTTKPKH